MHYHYQQCYFYVPIIHNINQTETRLFYYLYLSYQCLSNRTLQNNDISNFSCETSNEILSLFVCRMYSTAHFVLILVVLFIIHHSDSLVRYYLRVLYSFLIHIISLRVKVLDSSAAVRYEYR